MKNALAPLKRFIQNKNTVTIICVVVGILTLVIGYNYRVNKSIDLDVKIDEIHIKVRITKTPDSFLGISNQYTYNSNNNSLNSPIKPPARKVIIAFSKTGFLGVFLLTIF